MSQAMGFMMVFRASSIVGPLVVGLLFEATNKDIVLIKLTDFDSELIIMVVRPFGKTDQIHKMTTIFTENNNFFQPGPC